MRQPALLALADGSLFPGVSIGVSGQTVGEVVFNTAMTGYQEILTDPSYSRQIVTFTYPHIGNTGVNSEDEECPQVFASGLCVRDLAAVASSWRSRQSLSDYLREHQVIGIAEIDTRHLTRLLRDKGAQDGCIVAGSGIDENTALRAAREFPGLKGMDLARVVTTKAPYEWHEGTWSHHEDSNAAAPGATFRVVAYDYGIKRNILRMLVDRGCQVTVVPAMTAAEDVLAMRPDGVFLSNGPGDPEPCDYALDAVRTLLDKAVPLFGICLGHQLLALASGARTVKMKFGHHGANHPVVDLDRETVMITSQNHGFAVDEASLPSNLRATHRSLFDSSLQGVHRTDKPAFGFQGHPEASPGPHDAGGLFDRFIELMKATNKFQVTSSK